MSFRLRLKNSSVLARKKLLREIEGLRARVQAREGNVFALLDSLYVASEKILSRVGEPSFDPSLLPFDADPDPIAWNRNMEELEQDLSSLYEESAEIRNLRAESLNAAMMFTKELQERANYAQTLITDLRLLAGQLDQEVLVAGDDFANTDRIDQGFPLTFAAADVNTLQGIVTLRKTSTTNVLSPNARIQVTPIGPSAALNRLPTPDNTARFYEGFFYAPMGEARPEGGAWHLEERVRPGVVVPGASDIFKLDFDAGQDDPFKDFPDLSAEASNRPQGFPLNPEDIVVIDRGANLEQLSAVRRRIVDGDADTFWECEFILNAPELDALAKQLSGIDKAANSNVIPLGNADLPQVALITPEELRARAARSDIDRFDFEVELVFDLESRQSINFITINPMNFGETAWLEVIDVSTASSEDDGFHQVEGFGEQTFDNILTNEANEELTEGELKTTLAPNRYTYRGLGVYTFPPRLASRIRIRLRQRTPIPVPYERTVVQLNRTLSASSTKFKGDACFPGDTPILTPGGPKHIADLKVGDLIMTFDDVGVMSLEAITTVKKYSSAAITKIVLWNGDVVRTTPHHRFKTVDGWKKAADIKPHDRIVQNEKWRSGFASVRDCIHTTNHEPVYNIYTTGSHTYIAGGLLVHNFTTLPWLRTLWHRLFVDGKYDGKRRK